MVHPGPEVVNPGPDLVHPELFYFSKLFKVLKKYFRNINSFMLFQVGPEVVQGGPLLVQPRVSSTVSI